MGRPKRPPLDLKAVPDSEAAKLASLNGGRGPSDIDDDGNIVSAPWLPSAQQAADAAREIPSQWVAGVSVLPANTGDIHTLADARKAIEASADKYNGLQPPTPQNAAEAAREHIEAALRLVFPDSVWDDSAAETARRVLGYWTEFVPEAEPTFKFTTFQAAKSQMILVGDIEFASLCAHHLLPFTGKIHIGYIANDVQVGLSKIPRLVNYWARRPQVQEQLTAQLLHDLRERLGTKDVIVVCEARHTCVSARGTRLHNGVMRTSLPSGLFMSSPPARAEFLSLLAREGV